EQHQEEKRQVEEVTMNVLEDEGEASLAEISLAGFADRAVRRVLPEGFVVGAAIVVTREPEAARSPKNQHCRRKRKEGGEPGGDARAENPGRALGAIDQR